MDSPRREHHRRRTLVAHEAAVEHKLRARLESLARADQRLLDAYQAQVISLEELSERCRGRVAEQRQALGRQLETARTLRQSRIKAQAGAIDLAVFCARSPLIFHHERRR
jgi:site-specific DNA recombinase